MIRRSSSLKWLKSGMSGATAAAAADGFENRFCCCCCCNCVDDDDDCLLLCTLGGWWGWWYWEEWFDWDGLIRFVVVLVVFMNECWLVVAGDELREEETNELVDILECIVYYYSACSSLSSLRRDWGRRGAMRSSWFVGGSTSSRRSLISFIFQIKTKNIYF